MEAFAGELVGRSLAKIGVNVRTGVALTGGSLYALGDVNHHALLAHQGKYQARIAAAIAGRAPGSPPTRLRWAARRHRGLPGGAAGVLLRPPAGAVELTADQAERAGHRIRVVDVDLGAAVPGRACRPTATPDAPAWSSTKTRATCSASPSSAPGVEELIHSATIAVAGRVPISRLWHAVPYFPSISEAWLRLLEGYGPERRVAVDS